MNRPSTNRDLVFLVFCSLFFIPALIVALVVLGSMSPDMPEETLASYLNRRLDLIERSVNRIEATTVGRPSERVDN
jgi:hypothetical protein